MEAVHGSVHPTSTTTPNSSGFLTTLRAPLGKNEIKGSLSAGIISTVISLNPVYGILSFGISLLASRIDRVVSPLFRNDRIEAFFSGFGSCTHTAKLLVKTITVLTIANFVLAVSAPFIGIAIEISIVSSIIFTLTLSVAKEMLLPKTALQDPFLSNPEGKMYILPIV